MNEHFEEILKFYNVEKRLSRPWVINPDRLYEKFETSIKRYLARVESVKNDPTLVILEEGIDGIRWTYKSSAEGKAHLRKLENERIENEAHAEMMANISETVFEDLCEKTVVSKVEIRQGLDKYGKFSVDNLNEVVELLTDEGIEVK